MQLRISSGFLKNKKLIVPQSAKPVKERVKLAVFSIIGDEIENKKILDLFSGTGNLGFESISRGSKSCMFIENDYEAIGALMKNIKNIANDNNEIRDKLSFEKSDATKYIANHDGYYDVVFVDPPYDMHIIHILKYIHESIKEDGLILYFHSTNYHYNLKNINSKLRIVETRKYGLTTVDFIKQT